MKLPADWYDLATVDGRTRASHFIKHWAQLPDALRDALLDLLRNGSFPKRKGRPSKSVAETLRDDLRAIALRDEPGISASDAGKRDRAYRPNRKRKGGGKK